MEGYSFAFGLLIFSLCLLQTQGIPLRTQNTLVLVDNMAFLETHSLFFETLKAHNHTLTVDLYSNKPALVQYDSYLFDNLVFMVPSGEQSLTKYSSLIIKDFLAFFDSPDKNIMIIADPAVFPFTRKFANEFGVDFDSQSSYVTDGVDNKVSAADILDEDESLFTKTSGIIYQGVGLRVSSRNPYVFPILKSAETDFSLSPTGEVLNEAPILVAGYQSFNNNRVTITGSTMMCSNMQIAETAKSASHTSSPNFVFCEELIEWNFGESGILKTDNVFYKSNKEAMATEYPVKTDLVYQVDLFQWDKKIGQWGAFDNADAQIEYTMMGPYYRVPLVQVESSKPTYEVELKTPDRLGIFQFKVNYTRKGFTTFNIATKVSVRQVPFEEEPRFMLGALPYHVSVLITMLGFFIFVVKLMFSKD